MGKYYYVWVNNYKEPEMQKELLTVIEPQSLGCYEPVAHYLKGIKATTKKRETKFLGMKYDESYIEYTPFPLLFELKKTEKGSEYFSDVVTGSNYLKSTGPESNYSPNPVLSPAKEIPVGEVVKRLESLTEDEIIRYKNGIINMEHATKIGYAHYVDKVKATNQKLREDEDFIRRFRNKHGR